MVTGAGPIGALAAMASLAVGAGEVYLAEPNPSRAAFVRSLDLGMVLTDVGDDLVDRIRDLTHGEGIDVAIECAGKEAALNACVDSVKPQGTIVQTALHVAPARTNPERWAARDLTLEGTWCYAVTDWPRVIRLIATGRFAVERIVTAQLPLERVVTDGFDRLMDASGDQV